MPKIVIIAVCRLPGIHGAPRVGDNAEWSLRIRPGISTDLPNTKVEAERGVPSVVGNPQDVRDACAAVRRIAGIRKIDMRLVSGHQMGWD